MSESDSEPKRKKAIDAIFLVAILAVAAIVGSANFTVIPHMPPITTPTTVPGVTLHILTRYETPSLHIFEDEFLGSDYAQQNQITDIVWRTASTYLWDEYLISGEVDLVWIPSPDQYNQVTTADLLEPLNSTRMLQALSRVNDTMGGVPVKGCNSEGQVVWCSSSFNSLELGLTVNHTFLDKHGLLVPDQLSDLADLSYGSTLPDNPSIAISKPYFSEVCIALYAAQIYGWSQAWRDLISIAGSARIYNCSEDASNAVAYGNSGLAFSCLVNGLQPQYESVSHDFIGIGMRPLVTPDIMGIPTHSTKKQLAEEFIDFILSNNGQSLFLHPDLGRLPLIRDAFDQPLGLQAQSSYEAFNRTVHGEGVLFDYNLFNEISIAIKLHYESVLLDAHNELAICWAAIVAALQDSHINTSEAKYYTELMTTPVTISDPLNGSIQEFTLQYARDVSAIILSNFTYCVQIRERWTTAAIAQYNDVYSQIMMHVPH